MLEAAEETCLEILPNGEIRARDWLNLEERKGKQPLTMLGNVGGEYVRAA